MSDTKSWPEQDAVNEWYIGCSVYLSIRERLRLSKMVTRERLRQQRRAEKAEEENALLRAKLDELKRMLEG